MLRSLSQAAICPPVYHTQWTLHTIPFNAERQAVKLGIPISVVFDLSRPRIELNFTGLVADALSIRPRIVFNHLHLWWFGKYAMKQINLSINKKHKKGLNSSGSRKCSTAKAKVDTLLTSHLLSFGRRRNFWCHENKLLSYKTTKIQ